MNATMKLPTALMPELPELPELPTPTPLERELPVFDGDRLPALTAEQQAILQEVEVALAHASDKGLKFCFGGVFDQKDKVIIRSHMPIGEAPLELYTVRLGLAYANLPLDLLQPGE